MAVDDDDDVAGAVVVVVVELVVLCAASGDEINSAVSVAIMSFIAGLLCSGPLFRVPHQQ